MIRHDKLEDICWRLAALVVHVIQLLKQGRYQHTRQMKRAGKCVKAFPGNPYDGHTLRETPKQVDKLSPVELEHAFLDICPRSLMGKVNQEGFSGRAISFGAWI